MADSRQESVQYSMDLSYDTIRTTPRPGCSVHENGRGLSLGLTMVLHMVVVGQYALQLLNVVVVVGQYVLRFPNVVVVVESALAFWLTH
jgi:hypothetical protein